MNLVHRLRFKVINASLLLSACSVQPPPGITPTSGFDLIRYSGKWYEIARLDHRFEQGLTDVSACYTPQQDGRVQVINRGFDPETQRWKEAKGHARFVGEPSIASLKVSFFGPFYGGYHVVMLDPRYRWAMVVGNDRSYLWILARDKQLPNEVITPLLAQAKQLGFNTDALVWVSQTRIDG